MIMKNSIKKLISLAVFAFSVFCLSACNGNTNYTDPCIFFIIDKSIYRSIY